MPPETNSPTPSPPQAATHPMQHGHRPASSAQVPSTLVPEAGWHVLHLFYRVDRGALAGLSESARREGREVLIRALDKSTPGAPEQIHAFAVPGHKADFGIMMAGRDLKALHAVQTAIQASPLGPALTPTYSFYPSPRSRSTSPTSRPTGASSATARGSTPRAASTRPSSRPMPIASVR